MPHDRPAGRLRRLLEPYRALGSSLWSMFFATMINRFGDFVAPFLSLYLSRALGFDAAHTGTLVALTFGASTVGALFSGRLADALGRKQSLLGCQAAAAACNLAMSFLFREAWAPWLIVVGSLFRGAARPLIGAVLTDLSPLNRRKEVFGLQYWSVNVGVAVGPIVAAFLFNNHLPWLFRGDALSTLVSVALIATGVTMPSRAASAATSLERRDERGALRAFLARPILLAFCALALMNSMTYSQTGFSLPLTLSGSMGASGTTFFGFMMSLNAIVVILLSIPVARLLRSRAPLFCMALSGLFYVVGFGMLSAPLGRGGFVLSTIIWTIGEIVAATNIGIFIAKHSPENWRGSFQSFTGVFFQGGWSIGPLLAGPLVKSYGYHVLWLAVAALCLVWAGGAILVDRWDSRIGATPVIGDA
ncbi:MAG TPA: MFS transporter [Rectinemataceae bacterium]|nr:MFS transporter [Rectinemataceae bacterium]